MTSLPRQRCVRLVVLSLPLLLLAAGSARADRYYLFIFGAQTHPKIPRYTHTFCTMVRVIDPAPGCSAPGLEVHTISWLPATLKVKPYRLHAETGYNLTLEETLSWCVQNKMRASLWGPYAISERLYAAVYQEYTRFESGEFLYRAVDPPRRGDIRSDCIHAVTDVDGNDSRMRFLVIGSGDAVTRKFVRILRNQGKLALPSEDLSWLESLLRLDYYGVLHRPNP